MKLLSSEVQYLILFVSVIILPKLLLRFRIPVGITCLSLGFFTTAFLNWFQGDQLLLMLSRLGITSLFLFAGMEIELDELKKDGKTLSMDLLKSTVLLFAIAYGLTFFFDLSYRAAIILSLGLMTPSTGFILNSLKNYTFSAGEEYWIRSKAIAKEIVAILILFVALQSSSWQDFLVSKAVLVLLIVFLPLLFKFFLRIVAPYAPDTEVGFLILVALISGVVTKKIGTYYLVGAFIVGIVAGNFKHFISKDNHENILRSLSVFFSFFVPFYFYKAGLTITTEMFSMKGLIIGLVFLLVFLAIRVLSVFVTVKYFIPDFWKNRLSISMSLLPTLIFGLVIVSILRERFDVSPEILSGLIVYTVVSSLIPSFVFEKAPPVFHDTSMGR
ncbi:cation:proton antiporter [Halobacteriovorax sp. GB3]|uniref:cation:proton antiporter n=1 Tax=Halobacteriovorax sp. GB3 TaxID=2719615 RepID=UPI0023612F53|nr:cation:proton antiporter [Halobacteriovorax sp. GB3]MDD0852218.1 cation:proton antiporter [Halobacteriovorax sp. GB3]